MRTILSCEIMREPKIYKVILCGLNGTGYRLRGTISEVASHFMLEWMWWKGIQMKAILHDVVELEVPMQDDGVSVSQDILK